MLTYKRIVVKGVGRGRQQQGLGMGGGCPGCLLCLGNHVLNYPHRFNRHITASDRMILVGKASSNFKLGVLGLFVPLPRRNFCLALLASDSRYLLVSAVFKIVFSTLSSLSSITSSSTSSF